MAEEAKYDWDYVNSIEIGDKFTAPDKDEVIEVVEIDESDPVTRVFTYSNGQTQDDNGLHRALGRGILVEADE